MFKKIIYLLVFSFLISCSKEQSNEYAKISGLIANNGAKEILILGKGFKKVLPVALDGSFSDTIKVKKNSFYTFYDGKDKLLIFVANGNNLAINYDYNKMKGSFNVEGKGASTTKFLVAKHNFDVSEKINDYKAYYKLDKTAFKSRIAYLETEIEKLFADKTIDSTIAVKERNYYNQILGSIKKRYTKEHLLLTTLGKGTLSPTFKNYLSANGKKVSLSDFKGKYVYLDIWATWCGPCRQQIPFLEKMEKKYRNKNIKFISISVDDARRNQNSWDKARTKWKNMLKSRKMHGIQLFADNGFQSEFIKAYGINSIPRFILIDPNGKIVNANAPRPSQDSLKQLLDGLL